MNQTEFSHVVSVDGIAALPKEIVLTATPDQCTGLAARFGLGSIEAFTARLSVAQEARGLHVTGTVSAQLQYLCRVSAEPFPGKVHEPINILFLEGVTEADLPSPEEAALNPDPMELLPLHGHELDLGEIAAESLGLALEPFPRGPNADTAMKQLGILSEEQARLAASPFAALAVSGQKPERQG